MSKHKSTLDILRTNVVNGLEDDRLLYLLRIKIIRKLESIIVGKVFTNIVVVTARRQFGTNYSISQLKRLIDIDKSIGVRTFKKTVSNFYNIIKDYSDKVTEYKNGVRSREEYLDKLNYLEKCYKKSKKFKKVEGYICSNIFKQNTNEDMIIINRDNVSRSMTELGRGSKINIAVNEVNSLLRHSLGHNDNGFYHDDNFDHCRTLNDFILDYLPSYVDMPIATMAVAAVAGSGTIPLYNHPSLHIESMCKNNGHIGSYIGNGQSQILWSKTDYSTHGLLIINREDVNSIDKEPWWYNKRNETVYPKYLNKELEIPKVDIFRKVEDNTLSVCNLNTLTKTDLGNLSKIINIKKLGNKKPYLEMNKKFNRRAK